MKTITPADNFRYYGLIVVDPADKTKALQFLGMPDVLGQRPQKERLGAFLTTSFAAVTTLAAVWADHNPIVFIVSTQEEFEQYVGKDGD